MSEFNLHPIADRPGRQYHSLHSVEVETVVAGTVTWYETIGFAPPWIGYLAEVDGVAVGSCAFKGAPKNGKVELAYQTFEQFRGKGIGTRMCQSLILLASSADSSIIITARTLREAGHSTRILEKTGFSMQAEIIDEDGTPVWEWVLNKPE